MYNIHCILHTSHIQHEKCSSKMKRRIIRTNELERSLKLQND